MPIVPPSSPPRAGQAVAFIFIALGIFRVFAGAGIGGLWIAFIGWFLLQASRESYVRVGLTHALEGVRVADVMSKDCPTVDGWLNLQILWNTSFFAPVSDASLSSRRAK